MTTSLITDGIIGSLVASGAVAGGSALTFDAVKHNGQLIKWDTAAGTTITLPTAAGTMAWGIAFVTVLATSNSHIVQAAGSDLMIGEILGARTDSGNAVLGFCANGSSHKTITLNRTTTGSVNKGEWVMFQDVATNLWFVRGFLTATGAAFATPFS